MTTEAKSRSNTPAAPPSGSSTSSDSLASAVLAALEQIDRPTRSQVIADAAETVDPDHLVEVMSDQDDSRRRNAAMEALSRGGTRSVPALLRALKANDPEVVMFAANVLGRTRDPAAIPHLVSLLEHTDPNVAQAAIDSLAQLRATVAINSLVKILDRDPWLRFAAVNALGEIGDSKAVEPLASLLSDETIRLGVIEALGKIGSAEALGHLARMLHESQDSATFGACLKAIGQALESQPDEKLLKNIGSWARLSSPEAADVQMRMAKVLTASEEQTFAGDHGVSKKEASAQLVRALRLRPLYTTLVLAGCDPTLREVLEFCAVSIGREISPALGVGLSCSNRNVRLLACRCIGALGTTDLVTGVMALLGDPDETLRAAAVQALARLRHSDSTWALTPLLSDASFLVRNAAVGALAQLDSQAVTTALIQECANQPSIRLLTMDIMRLNPHPAQLSFIKQCLCDPDASLRSKAISTLASHLGANAVDFLQPLLADPDVSTRRAAVAALGQMRHSSVNQVLLRHLEMDPETRAEVIRALMSLGDNSVGSRLVNILQGESGTARLPVIEALGQIGDPVAEPALIKLLASEEAAVRRAAVMALSRFSSRVVMRHLVAAAKDSDVPVRQAVVEALAQHADPAARAALARLCLDMDLDVAKAARRHTETIG